MAHAVSRLVRERDDVALCGADVTPLPNLDWSEPHVGVLRCRECESMTE